MQVGGDNGGGVNFWKQGLDLPTNLNTAAKFYTFEKDDESDQGGSNAFAPTNINRAANDAVTLAALGLGKGFDAFA